MSEPRQAPTQTRRGLPAVAVAVTVRQWTVLPDRSGDTMPSSDLPLAFLAGDHRHLPAISRPGPHLQAAMTTAANGGRPPRRAAQAADRFRVAADGFVATDERTITATVALATADRRRPHHLAAHVTAHLDLVGGDLTATQVVTGAARQRHEQARSYNAFVDGLEHQARAAYRHAAAWRAAVWVGPLVAMAGTVAALLGG